VATPDFAHAAPVLALLEAGADVQRQPLATRLDEARRMARVWRVPATLCASLQPLAPVAVVHQRGVREQEMGQPVQAYYRPSDTIHVPTGMLSRPAAGSPFLFP
jgi:hypothetical protein